MKRLSILLSILLSSCASTKDFEFSRADAFAVAKTADVVTTKIALSKGAVEANPLMASLGFNGFLAVSIGLIYLVYKYEEDIPVEAVTALSVITAAGAVNNINVINRIP